MHREIVRKSNRGKKPERCRFSYPDSSRFSQKGSLAREGGRAEEEVEDEEEEETDREEKHREIGHFRHSEVSVVAASLLFWVKLGGIESEWK